MLRETRIRYVIRQTLQPSPRLTSFCRTGLPVVRSDVLGTGASQYVFELYRLDGCHEPPPPPQTAIEQSRTVRRVLNAAIVHDLTLSGKGLGAPLAAGNTREPEGYGFEQSYLNVIHKFGLFALPIFAAYALIAWRIVSAARSQRLRIFGWAASAVFGAWILAAGNPTLMGPISVSLQAVVLYLLRPRPA